MENVRKTTNAMTNAYTTTFRRRRTSSRCSKNESGRSVSPLTVSPAEAMIEQRGRCYLVFRRRLVSKGVTVLGPGVRGVAVPADFPVSGLILRHERDLAKPLRALPSVPLRHTQPHGPPVLERQGPTVVTVRQQNVGVEEHVEREVRRVPRVPAGENYVLCLRFRADEVNDRPEANALPVVVEPRPRGHTVEVRSDLDLRQGEELIPGQRGGPLDGAVHPQRPRLRVEPRDDPEVEAGPPGGDVLPGGEPRGLHRTTTNAHTD